ncbi:MAG: hypothetical protein FJ240_07455 [Nitrospira sp.]|nr:hypothetical protein [Nitrospira sp.]
MKKSIIYMIIICALFVFSGCGGGGGGGVSGNTPVTISVSFQNNSASSINPKGLLTHVHYTVTGPNMVAMEGTVPVVGDAADIYLLVPTGQQREFYIEIFDSSGERAYYSEKKKVDLTGEAITIELALHKVQVCNDVVQAGANKPESFTIELEKKSGAFRFDYETYSIKDRLIITYEGNTLYDSGCIGTNGTKTEYISYSGNSSSITIEVQPNCEGTASTQWNFVVYCPQEQENTIVGAWAHVALERLNDGTWGSILEKVVFRNDGTGAEINRRVNYGGFVNSFNRIDFTYSTNPNQDGSTNLTIVYPDRTLTHKIIMSDNGNMVIIDRTSDASSKRMDVAIKMDTAKSYTAADFSGDYYAMGYSYDINVLFSPGLNNTFSTIASFDGIGEYSYEGTWHSDEIIFTQSQVAPYAVTNIDGSILAGGNFSGYLGESGLFITSHPTINNHWRMTFGMQKQDKIYSTADLAGTWAIAGFGDTNGESFGDVFGIMVCNNSGNCTATLKNQKDGDVLNEQFDFTGISVDPDGSFGYFENTIAPSYSAVIGNNGNTIMMNMSFGQSDLYERDILVGVKCSGCSNLAGQAGKVRTKNIYFKKRNNVSNKENQNPAFIKIKGGT